MKNYKSLKMRNFRLFIQLVATSIFLPLNTYAENPKLPYWKDIQTVSVNREEPRSAFMTYADKTQAMTGKYESSTYYRLLNGIWKFYFTESYKNLPANITDKDIDLSGWKDIQVPGNWEIQGFGTARYTNHG